MDPFLIMAIALIVIMVLSTISQRKRAKKIEAMRDAIKCGDTVITIGGFTGTIVETPEDEYIISCEGTNLRVKRWAISSVVGPKTDVDSPEVDADKSEVKDEKN